MTRERWAAREMAVVRWFKHAQERVSIGEPICELCVDGQMQTVVMPGPDEMWGIYGPLVEIGDEVPTGGELFEYSNYGAVLKYPLAHRLHPRWPAYRRRERYPRIFINYRREDAEAFAGRLHEALGNRFGHDEVFMSLFSIRPGEPFAWTIQQSVAHCDVMLSVVGPKWLTVTATNGTRRLDDVHDFVRREIVASLDRQILLLPVLVDGATVPTMEQLPEDVRGFEQLQMLELSARRWKTDVDELVAAIDAELKPTKR